MRPPQVLHARALSALVVLLARVTAAATEAGQAGSGVGQLDQPLDVVIARVPQ